MPLSYFVTLASEESSQQPNPMKYYCLLQRFIRSKIDNAEHSNQSGERYLGSIYFEHNSPALDADA